MFKLKYFSGISLVFVIVLPWLLGTCRRHGSVLFTEINKKMYILNFNKKETKTDLKIPEKI